MTFDFPPKRGPHTLVESDGARLRGAPALNYDTVCLTVPGALDEMNATTAQGSGCHYYHFHFTYEEAEAWSS